MSITVTYTSQLSILETLTGVFLDPNDATITINGMNTGPSTFTATTTVPVTKRAAFQKALSTGAGTIDLTNLPGQLAGEVVDGTGLKVRMIKWANPSTNTGAMTITPGASDAYNLLGATFKRVLSVGQEDLYYLDDDAPTIGSGAKNIDIAGTGTEALNIEIVIG